jgi:hypothetical protein
MLLLMDDLVAFDIEFLRFCCMTAVCFPMAMLQVLDVGRVGRLHYGNCRARKLSAEINADAGKQSRQPMQNALFKTFCIGRRLRAEKKLVFERCQGNRLIRLLTVDCETPSSAAAAV